MRYQLRIYGVLPGHGEDWAREWAEAVVPLRQAHGFEIVGGWLTDDKDRFIWIVGHDDFEKADAAYYEAPERTAIHPEPTRHLDLDRIEVTFLLPALNG